MRELDDQLSSLFGRWDATQRERDEFVKWAWTIAVAADSVEDSATAATLLSEERDLAHHFLTERLHATTTIDLNLVSKRMFLDWLARALHERTAVETRRASQKELEAVSM